MAEAARSQTPVGLQCSQGLVDDAGPSTVSNRPNPMLSLHGHPKSFVPLQHRARSPGLLVLCDDLLSGFVQKKPLSPF